MSTFSSYKALGDCYIGHRQDDPGLEAADEDPSYCSPQLDDISFMPTSGVEAKPQVHDAVQLDLASAAPPDVLPTVASPSEAIPNSPPTAPTAVPPPINHLDSLPSELITHIGLLSLLPSSSPLPLSFQTLPSPLAISPRFRLIFSRNPAFWSALSLLIASSADAETLRCEVSGEEEGGWKVAVAPEGMKVLLGRVLESRRMGEEVREDVWEGTFGKEERGGWFNTGVSRSAGYQRMGLKAYSFISSLRHSPSPASNPPPDLKRITRLAIRSLHTDATPTTKPIDFGPLLSPSVLPNLQDLILHSIGPLNLPGTVHLPSLRTLILSHISAPNFGGVKFVLPQLERVEWDDGDPEAYFDLLFPPGVDSCNTENLTHFSPPSTWSLPADPDGLETFLAQLEWCPAIESLDLTASDVTSSFLKHLVWSGDGDENGDGDGQSLLPELETLILSDNPGLDLGGLVEVVRSRAEGWERGECARIRGLQVEGCGLDGREDEEREGRREVEQLVEGGVEW